jgi:hypothetical protein
MQSYALRPRWAPKDDLDELDGRCGLCVFSRGYNYLKLLLDMFVVVASDVLKDFTGFFVATNGIQVTKGV